MKRRSLALLALCLITLPLLAACGVEVGSAPTLTPNPGLPATAAALFPTRVPTVAPTATPVARGDDGEQIARLLGSLENAVITGDLATYRSLVDLETDPIFGLEHGRWIDDLARVRAHRFDLTVRNLTVSGDEATADLNLAWSTLGATTVSLGADFPARFRRGADGQWRYAGEAWAAPIETDHFRIRAMPGLEALAAALPDVLPGVYARVTEVLDYEPGAVSEIKLYDNPWALIATVRLSLTREIAGWNEPGEALKLAVESEPPGEALLAHEFTHFVMFDMAGTTRGAWPWWLSEGMAEYAASGYWTLTDRNRRIAQVKDLRDRAGLPDWDDLAVFETTPESLWPYAYSMGYAMVAYVTEAHGDAGRIAWVRGMAAGDLETATQAALGLSFADLDAAFLAWLDGRAG